MRKSLFGMLFGILNCNRLHGGGGEGDKILVRGSFEIVDGTFQVFKHLSLQLVERIYQIFQRSSGGRSSNSFLIFKTDLAEEIKGQSFYGPLFVNVYLRLKNLC